MNRNRMLVIAFVALALSGLVAFAAYRLLQSRLAPPEDTIDIVVASEKLNLGTRLTEKQLRLMPWSKTTLPEGAFANPADIIGRGVITPMSPNEPILESKLASREAGVGLTSAIPEGMRAVAVKVNDVIGVAGFVTPGTRVDVIITGTPGQGGTDVSKIFLENVQILSAGQNVAQDRDGKPQNVQVVTMLVTPEDAQKLALAGDSRIQLALRNPLDLAHMDPPPAKKSDLYSSSSDAAPPEQVAPQTTRTVRRAPRRVAPRPQVTPVEIGPPKITKFDVETIQGPKRETKTFVKEGQ